MKKWGLLVLIPLLIFLIGCSVSKMPEPKGFVNDFANMISDDVEKSLESTLVQYKQKTTNEIAVVTVKTIGDQSVEDYTIRLAEKWKVGKKDKDNGVIILIAEKEKKIRIEVGYGLEPVLTDAKAGAIIGREMTPRFKSGDYTGGIKAGVNAVIAALEGSYTPSNNQPISAGGFPLWLIVVIILGGIMISIIIAGLVGGGSGGGGGSWSSGSGGSGGGGGFGGGSFGGGGASGGW